VIGGILLVAIAQIDEHGVALIAPVPSGLPSPVAPEFDRASELLPGAFAIALMVMLETLAVARTVRKRTEPEIDNNQELVANGLSCAAGAFFRAMPSAGGFSQTAINQSAGARTQLSELVTVVLAVGCALFLGDVLSDLPAATLGCMVIIAVIGLIQPAEMARYWRLSKIEFWIASATAVTGLVFGLLVAVLVGVLLTLVLLIVELDRIDITELQPTPGHDDVRPAGDDTRPLEGLLVLRFDGPLYTANVRSENQKILRAVDARPGTRVVVIDGTALAQVTVTVIDEVAELETALGERGVTLWFAGLTPAASATAHKLPRWSELEAAGRVHPTSLSAIQAFDEM
jgi:MFS superfamily sulfate permease-like transporter